MINWANWNSLVNPGGKLTSVVPIDFWLLNSSSRLQNAIPGKTVCKVLLSTLPSWKTSFMSMLAAKKILQKCQIDVNSTATSFRIMVTVNLFLYYLDTSNSLFIITEKHGDAQC